MPYPQLVGRWCKYLRGLRDWTLGSLVQGQAIEALGMFEAGSKGLRFSG